MSDHEAARVAYVRARQNARKRQARAMRRAERDAVRWRALAQHYDTQVIDMTVLRDRALGDWRAVADASLAGWREKADAGLVQMEATA